MTEADEVAQAIYEQYKALWPLTIAAAKNLAKGQMPEETPQVIDSVAEALFSLNCLSARKHDLIETGDPDSTSYIEDSNGDVVLAVCRVCGQIEADLADECPGHRVCSYCNGTKVVATDRKDHEGNTIEERCPMCDFVKVPRYEMQDWANELSLHGVGDIDAAKAMSRIVAAAPKPVQQCGSCEPSGVFATDGSGPYDCPDCGKKAKTTGSATVTQFFVHPDNAAFEAFAIACKKKLAKARAKGYTGWNDPTQVTVQYLAEQLINHLSKGNAHNFEDIANFAMMLHQRGADPKVLAEAKDAVIKAAVGKALELGVAALESAQDKAPVWRTDEEVVDQTIARRSSVIHAQQTAPADIKARCRRLEHLLGGALATLQNLGEDLEDEEAEEHAQHLQEIEEALAEVQDQ